MRNLFTVALLAIALSGCAAALPIAGAVLEPVVQGVVMGVVGGLHAAGTQATQTINNASTAVQKLAPAGPTVTHAPQAKGAL